MRRKTGSPSFRGALMGGLPATTFDTSLSGTRRVFVT
jgi:hypothetical protein